MARTWPGTICHLQAVPRQYIDEWPDIDPLTQTMQGTITLKPGKSWNIIKLIANRNGLNEQNTFEPGGIQWAQTISGVLYGQSIHNHLQVNNWAPHQWVLIAREIGSEINYLVGNPFSGARLSAIYNNQETTITSLQFDHISTKRAIIYQGTLIAPLFNSGPGITPVAPGIGGTSIEFLVGDTGTIADQGTTYTNAALIGKPVMVFIDGMSISHTAFLNRFSLSYNMATGAITFSDPVNAGQLVQIFY
jgi:hypothetical protein